MQIALITLSGAFALELCIVIFGGGRLFQLVHDIDQRVIRIEDQQNSKAKE